MNQVIYVSSPLSQQIHVWHMDYHGKLTLVQVIDTPGNVQPMIAHPSNNYLYVGARPDFSLITYYIDQHGLLNQLNRLPLNGSPTHMSINVKSNTLYCVSYKNSSLIAISLNEKHLPHVVFQILLDILTCHSANVDIRNNLLWVPCLKEDLIRIFKICVNGQLVIPCFACLSVASGAGPRHMALNDDTGFNYIINECHSTINIVSVNSIDLIPKIIKVVDIIPQNSINGIAHTCWAADIHLTPDKQWLYCSDRATSTISCFKLVDRGKSLELCGFYKTEYQPRGFAIDTEGNYLVVAGEKSNYISVYAINKCDGRLFFLSRYCVGLGPMWITIIKK